MFSGETAHAFGHPVVDLTAPPSGLESVVRLWSPRGEEGEVIGDDEAADPDPDSRSLEDIAQSNQGSMDSGEALSRAPGSLSAVVDGATVDGRSNRPCLAWF